MTTEVETLIEIYHAVLLAGVLDEKLAREPSLFEVDIPIL